MSDGFYSTNEWHKLRSKTKAMWKRDQLPCGYCNKPIDWTQRPIVDHKLNRKQYPDLALVSGNLQVVHHACNSKKYAYEEANTKIAVRDDGFPTGSEWS